MKSLLRFMLVLVAALPLAVSNGSLFLYVEGKTFFLRGVIFIVSIVFAYVFISDRQFKKEVVARIRTLSKQTIVRLVALSWILLAISTLLASDRSMAFFSTVERGEGFIGLTACYLFFLFTSVVFSKKDWIRFFSATLAVGWVTFLYQIMQAIGGMVRPSSFLGNPIYLAVYFLFTLFASLVVANESRKDKKSFQYIAGIGTAIMSVIGIFITESRGVLGASIVALIVGYAAYLYLHRKSSGEKKMSKLAVGVVIVLVVFGAIFFATKKDAVWQHVPGLNRIATSSFKEGNTQARIINTKISLEAVNPKNESVKTMLVGWGWDNYLFAWQKYYDPALYGFDTSVFDRPHDKLLDTLVMTGVLGLAAYLALWFFFLRAAVSEGKRSPYIATLFIFWSVAYFVQNLTAFDTLTTFVIFLTMISYLVSLHTDKERIELLPVTMVQNGVLSVVFITIAVFMGVAFVAWTLIPHLQMNQYTYGMKREFVQPDVLLNDSFVFSPMSYASQGGIRSNMLTIVLQQYDAGTITASNSYLDLALKEALEYATLHPNIYQNWVLIGKAYEANATLKNDPSLLTVAEGYYQKAVALMSERQEGVYLLAINLLKQGKIQQGLDLLESAVARNPEIPLNHYELAQAEVVLGQAYYDSSLKEFEIALTANMDPNPSLTKKSYEQFFLYYYKKRDFDDTLTSLKRLSTLDTTQTSYLEILKYMEKNLSLPDIEFN